MHHDEPKIHKKFILMNQRGESYAIRTVSLETAWNFSMDTSHVINQIVHLEPSSLKYQFRSYEASASEFFSLAPTTKMLRPTLIEK